MLADATTLLASMANILIQDTELSTTWVIISFLCSPFSPKSLIIPTKLNQKLINVHHILGLRIYGS